MNILVVGSGGREHALVWALLRSKKTSEVFCTKGNAGICELATCLDIEELDFDNIYQACVQNAIDLVVVGPELPLSLGIVDELSAKGVRVFGPNKSASRLESSKHFTKEFCKRHAIPTAASRSFNVSQKEQCLSFLKNHPMPVVIKADGLAAGKGVIICQTLEEAIEGATRTFGRYGGEDSVVVVEEFLEGVEASLFVACDGKDFVVLGTAQDHKRAYDGDLGPNTGGMGAFSPAVSLSSKQFDQALSKIIRPTVDGMRIEGNAFKGVLYAGLMINETGVHLIEYNVRFGDPECQVLLPRLATDLVDIVEGCLDGNLQHLQVEHTDNYFLNVVLASEGYPEKAMPSGTISWPSECEALEDILLFHAATARNSEGRLMPTGGRVMSVCASGDSLTEAKESAYRAVSEIGWPEGFYRTDIGLRACLPA